MVVKTTRVTHAFFGHTVVIFYNILTSKKVALLTVLFKVLPELTTFDGFSDIDRFDVVLL